MRAYVVTLLILTFAAAPAAAQFEAPPRGYVGITGLYGYPVGEFADYIDRGFGL
ncbi:MAG: hypothetical protein GWN71_16025, partial [Gammaproteobacteria bacterium]|nr:hypothetical protein [Gemmatimonadota bacterium]NIU75029.1 hypothetical protein [Gammaproteobacteria bacterium]NIX22606.1 hypothetical protein [Actinomycetota bacterium]